MTKSVRMLLGILSRNTWTLDRIDVSAIIMLEDSGEVVVMQRSCETNIL